ncbi:MAG: secondary thiamine-phosphate synthase enzyme YjbQ [Nitrososphaerota archaeon]|nr:secondary thiamine-phosphate synthase enzyme YjbQ [Nitrososphaerota archaeon]
MPVYQEEVGVRTRGEGDVLDITDLVGNVVRNSGVRDGIVHIFAIGSTAAVSTMEYEPGLKRDLLMALERMAPRNAEYEHHLRWGDYNGHSHVRATMLGPSLSVPVRGGSLVLGTWQQIVFIELDTRPRNRKVVVTVMGE